jgi:predicted RNase H-like nuclease (RuvC/YqgF family)
MPDIAQSGRAKMVEFEWRKLPSTELTCITGKLRERGDSIESLSRRAILPSDARVADIRSQCGPARPTETEPAVVQPQLGNVPESAVTELRQTVEALKGNLADSAGKIAQLEKEKAEANNALKQAERDRLDAENARADIEQMAAAQKAAFATIAQLETDKASLEAKAHTWSLAAIGAIVALVACLLAWTFTRRMRSKTAATELEGKSPS